MSTVDSKTRWSNVTPSPHAPAAVEWRRAQLRAVHAPPIDNRSEYISKLCAGKRVLDVGVVDHESHQHENAATWLHRQIVSVASHTLGVDIVTEGVEALARNGYNVRRCDITTDRIDEVFDVMIVGEVIEHLSNPGALFEAAGRNLVAGGTLLVTTPNPYYINRVRLHMFAKSYDSADHVTYLFPSGMAELAQRAGMELSCYRGVKLEGFDYREPTRKLRFLRAIRPILLLARLDPDVFCETMVYEFRSSK